MTRVMVISTTTTTIAIMIMCQTNEYLHRCWRTHKSQKKQKTKAKKKQRSDKPKQKNYHKKVQADWTHENILQLIQEVEPRRTLWDMGSAEYKLPKMSLWQEIADAMGRSSDDCIAKWRHLRTSFYNKISTYRKTKSGQGTDESITITWKYFRPMMFLEANDVRQSTQSTPSMQLVNISIIIIRFFRIFVVFLGIFRQTLMMTSPF